MCDKNMNTGGEDSLLQNHNPHSNFALHKIEKMLRLLQAFHTLFHGVRTADTLE